MFGQHVHAGLSLRGDDVEEAAVDRGGEAFALRRLDEQRPDADPTAVPRLMRGLRSPCKAIIGPWVHKYPHFAVPEPRIGFLQEALRWWDFWLKGEPTGVTRDPAFRVYIMDAQKPGQGQDYWPGRWIGDELWGAGNSQSKRWYLNGDGIGGAPGEEKELTVFSPQSVGKAGGKYCIMWLGDGFPSDQREDDANSLTFDSPALAIASPMSSLSLRPTGRSPSSRSGSTMCGRRGK